MTAPINPEIALETLPEITLADSDTDSGATDAAVLHEKLTDALTPGYQVEFDPDEAERAGAFREDALSERDAAESTDDLADPMEEPAFDDEGPSAELPHFISTTNARELYDLREGETVAQAIARRNAKDAKGA